MKPYYMNPLQATCLLILFLTTSACRPERTETILSPAPSITPKSYLALGDSYTIGQGVSATERFPAQTAQWLQQKGIIIGTLTYIATTDGPPPIFKTPSTTKIRHRMMWLPY